MFETRMRAGVWVELPPHTLHQFASRRHRLVITLLLGRLPAPRSLPTPHSEGSRVTGLGRFGVELCRDRHCVTGPEVR